VFIDGPPLDLVSRLLPVTSKLRPSLLVHLHLHARAQASRGRDALDRQSSAKFGRRPMLGLIENLRSAIRALKYRKVQGAWGDYYRHTNYSAEAMAHKERIVSELLARVRPRAVWDLGANTGAFSRLTAGQGAYTVAFDGDHDAVEQHYEECRARKGPGVLPLVMDLANPSGRIGWNHAERSSLADRGPADVVLALGLIHHLSLANQVPFDMVAEVMARFGRALIIEFVAPTDSQVVGMLSRMPRLRDGYALEPFERAFARFFRIEDVVPIQGAERRLYLMRNVGAA
jgi:hypothetical protein